MVKKIKKPLALFLALVMCLGMMSTSVVAAGGRVLAQTINAGTVTKYVGEDGFYQRLPRLTAVCPRCGRIAVEYIPDSWTYGDTVMYDDTIVKNLTAINNGSFAGNDYGSSYWGLPCYELTYTAKTPGSTPVNIKLDYAYYADYEEGYCDYCGKYIYFAGNNTLYYDNISFTVRVVTDYTVTYMGEGVTTNTQRVGTAIASVNHSFTAASAPADRTENGKTYTFNGWLYSGDGQTYAAGASVPMTWEESDGANVQETMTAQWKEKVEKTYTVTYTDGVEDSVIFPDQGYEGLKEGDATPEFVGTPTRTGYTFMGWNSAVNPVVSAADADDDGNIVYTATWTKDPVPTTYTVVHEYYTNGSKDGFTKSSGNGNVGDTVKIADIAKNLTYTKGNETYTYTYTNAHKGTVSNNPDGYTYDPDSAAIAALTLAESGNIIVLRYDRTVTPPQPETPELEVNKEIQLIKAPDGTIRYDGKPQPGDTIQYQITVTNNGDEAVENVVIIDKLDESKLTFISASGRGKSWSSEPDSGRYEVGKLDKKNTQTTSSYVLTIIAQVKTDVPAGTTISNTATADCDNMPADNKPGDSANVTIPNPKLTKLEKVRLTEIPAGIDGTGINTDTNVVFVGDNAPAVTLLYKITVTGTEGAKYKVIDEDATHVGGDPLEGTIAKGETQAVIYVTKTFTKADVSNEGKLVNNATLESNDPVTPSNPGGTEGPTNGGATGEAGAKKQYNVTINFKTEDGTVLQDPSKTTVDEGADFNYSLESASARKARANSDVTAVVIPQRLGTNNEYVLDMTASAEGLAKLAAAKKITADVVADIIYSLDVKGTINSDGTDTFDNIPDRYQVKVTFQVKNGKWNDKTEADVVKYVVKYAADSTTMAADGTATLGDIIPAVGSEPDESFEAGNWDTTPTAETTVTADAVYTYTYKAVVVIPNPEYKVTIDPANGEEKTETTVKENAEFTVPAAPTAPEGKEFDGWKGSDGKDYNPGDKITVTSDLTLTAQWKDEVIPEPEKITVTWKSGYGENETLKTGEYDKGTATVPTADYPTAPSRGGYTFTGWSDPVADADGNLTITAQWTENTRPVTPDPEPDYYTLTIRYVYADGTTARPTVTRRNLEWGDRYSVTSPVIEGYTADFPVVEGTMPARNETVTVTYTAVEDVEETQTPTTETPETPVPSETSAPVETQDPTETPDPTETQEPDEGEDLGDNDTPLAENPEEGEDLSDNDTPLAEVPQTGDMLWLWMTLAIGSAVSLAWISAEEKKGKRVSK